MTRLLLLLLLLPACASSGRVTDALDDWRRGRRDDAIVKAHAEVERFRSGNAITQAEVDHELAEIDRWFRDETPILLPDKAPPPIGEPTPIDLDAGIRHDLASLGATRTLRALRVVERLTMQRFSTDLFVIVWRREPFTADGKLLADKPKALRSVTVKAAALRALKALR